jgi:hypothetical protein
MKRLETAFLDILGIFAYQIAVPGGPEIGFISMPDMTV